MNTRIVPIFAIATIALALAAPATAQTVVFNNGTPDFLTTYSSDSSVSRYSADDFTFTTATTFDTVRWYGVYVAGNTPTFPDAFTISFFDTIPAPQDPNSELPPDPNAKVPSATPRSGEVFFVGSPVRVDTGSDLQRFDVYQYEAKLSSPITMGVGTFAIQIENNTAADTDDEWGWVTSSTATGTMFQRSSSNGAFTSQTNNFAFQLINSAPAIVPEANTAALLGLALPMIGAVAVVRRRKK